MTRRWLVVAWLLAGPVLAQPVAIDFARFFGACDAQFGGVTDPAQATGECGIITVLTNRFNAQNPDVRLRTQIIEHRPYYNQIGGRVINRDVPAVAILHGSTLNDFVKRGLVEPLDAGFAEVGIATADFTPQALRAISVGGRPYALPLDTHSWLWHVNVNLLRDAGLADGAAAAPTHQRSRVAGARAPLQGRDRQAVLRDAHGERRAGFRAHADDAGAAAGRLAVPRAAHRHRAGRRRGAARGAAAAHAVRRGPGLARPRLRRRHPGLRGRQGAVMINGTWLLGDLAKEAERSGRPLSGGYVAVPFATLYARPGAWADNHLLVMLKGGTKTAAERRAALRFLRFIHDEGGAWARTGQLPTRRSVIASAAFRALPMRSQVAPLADYGAALPQAVARQSRVTTMLGDALTAVVVHGAPLEPTLATAQRSITRMLERDAQFTHAPEGSESPK